MEKKIEIIPLLADIVEKNTHSYQSDFSNDEARLTAAMLETYQENRTFLWMSRPCGTWCFLERDVFLQETPAHIVWTRVTTRQRPTRLRRTVSSWPMDVRETLCRVSCNGWTTENRSCVSDRTPFMYGQSASFLKMVFPLNLPMNYTPNDPAA